MVSPIMPRISLVRNIDGETSTAIIWLLGLVAPAWFSTSFSKGFAGLWFVFGLLSGLDLTALTFASLWPRVKRRISEAICPISLILKTNSPGELPLIKLSANLTKLLRSWPKAAYCRRTIKIPRPLIIDMETNRLTTNHSMFTDMPVLTQ